MSEAEQARVGVHSRLGEMPAGAIIERFITGHAEDHIAQLTEILAARTD
jgi:hypothetical protein